MSKDKLVWIKADTQATLHQFMDALSNFEGMPEDIVVFATSDNIEFAKPEKFLEQLERMVEELRTVIDQ